MAGIIMSWESILKFGPRQVPKPSLGSKKTIDAENLKPVPKKIKPKFVVSITDHYGEGLLANEWATLWGGNIQKFDTRDEAKAFLVKTMYEGRNPDPWTVEGDNERGLCIVYDGIFQVLGAPSYKYYIHPENEELPSPLQFDARVSNTTREAVLDRLEGRPYGTTKREDSDD